MSVLHLQVSSDRVWSYDAPVVTAVSPNRLLPGGGTLVMLNGVNFGNQPVTGRFVSSITIDNRPCVVPVTVNWTDTALSCVTPGGASADAMLAVIVGGSVFRSSSMVRYAAPVVVDSTPRLVDTAGGSLLTLTVTNVTWGDGLAVSVLLRRFATQSWVCRVVSANATTVTCVVPEGHGVGWHVVVVNTDSATGSSQQSAIGLPGVSYRPPTITLVDKVDKWSGSPTTGGFVVRVNGTNLSSAPAVYVSGLSCVITAVVTPHVSVTCTVPPMLADTPSTVTVSVDGQSASFDTPLRYDPPVVTGLTPSLMDAAEAANRPRLGITGLNFGLLFVSGRQVAQNHTVLINGSACENLQWLSDVALTCDVLGVFVVGNYEVRVAVGDSMSNASASAMLRLQCAAGMYGIDGQRCMACPDGAECAGGGASPVASVGYFPLSATSFVQCSPPDACLGGENGTCSSLYVGPRCASCAPGAYR